MTTPITIDVTAAPYSADNTGVSNATQAFIDASAALCAAGGGTLLIPPGTYTVGRQVRATQSNQGYAYLGEDIITLSGCSHPVVIEGTGATLTLANGLKFGSFDWSTETAYTPASLPFTDANYAASVGRMLVVKDNPGHVVVRGLELNGNASALSLGGQWGSSGYDLAADGIVVENADQVALERIYSHHHGHDGLAAYDVTASANSPRAPLSLLLCRSEYNARAALFWQGGNGLQAVDCKFSHSGRATFATAPAVGVMIKGVARNGHFLNSEMLNNVGEGVLASSTAADIKVERCSLVGTTAAPFAVSAARVHFVDSTLAGQSSVVRAGVSQADGDATRFSGCWLTDLHKYNNQVFISTGGNLLNWGAGSLGVQMDRCSVEVATGVLGQTNGAISASNCRFRQTSSGASAIVANFHGDTIFDTSGSNDLSTSLILGRMLFNSAEQLQYDQMQRRLRFYANTGSGGRMQSVGYCYSATAFASAFGGGTKGDIVYNTAPTPGGYLGWVCTVTGTPGTWKPFGLIAS